MISSRLIRLVRLVIGLALLTVGGLTAAAVYLGGLRLSFVPQPGGPPVPAETFVLLFPVLSVALPVLLLLAGLLFTRQALIRPQPPVSRPVPAPDPAPAPPPPAPPDPSPAMEEAPAEKERPFSVAEALAPTPTPAQPLPPGPEGVAHVLRSLPRAYAYLQGVDIGDSRPPIRHLLAGPHGVLIMTVIGLQGDIASEGNDWYRLTGSERHKLEPSPSEWLNRDVEAVSRFLERHGQGDVAVQGVVIVAGPNLRYTDQPTVPIIEVNRLRNYVPTLAAEEPLLPEKIEAVLRVLQG